MQYLALIYSPEDAGPQPTTPEGFEAMMQPWRDYTAYVEAEGAMLGGEALQPTATATTIRVRNGERILTDGPFAETREALGGFYLLEARDLDHAIELASKIPVHEYGSVEVRPIMKLPE